MTFRANCVRLFEVMRERKTFLNATFKVEKNPTYTGNHYMARVNRVLSNTYPLGTTEQEMIDKYHNSVVDTYRTNSIWIHGLSNVEGQKQCSQ